MSLKFRRLSQLKDKKLSVIVKLDNNTTISGVIVDLDENDIIIDDGSSEKIISLSIITQIEEKNLSQSDSGLIPIQINGETCLFNTSFSIRPLNIAQIEKGHFISGSHIPAYALDWEWNPLETIEQRKIRLQAMRVIPKEFVIGIDNSLFLGIEERDTVQNAMNLIRQSLGLSPRSLESHVYSNVIKAIHHDIQKHLLGDIANIPHSTDSIEQIDGQEFVQRLINTEARTNVFIFDKKSGLSGIIDMVYQHTILNIKINQLPYYDDGLNIFKIKINMSIYMHQLSAYHMITVEGKGEVNGERVLQSGIVPMTPLEGLSAQKRLAESVSTVKRFIRNLEEARETKNHERFKNLIEDAYGTEYLGESGFHMGKTIEYIKMVNDRLNNGSDWNVGILPIFGQEAMDTGATDVNLAKRLYDEDIVLLTLVDRYEWRETDIYDNLHKISKHILKHRADIIRQIQNFVVNRKGGIILLPF